MFCEYRDCPKASGNILHGRICFLARSNKNTNQHTRHLITRQLITRFYHNLTLEPNLKYFIYSPSGGFNNQRIEFEYALVIAKLLRRTLIVPPMGKHSSFFGRYELLQPTQMVAMDRIFDFQQIQQFHHAIPMGNQRIVTFVKLLQNQKYDVRTVFHPERLNWKESHVLEQLAPIKSQVLFLRGAEMYHAWGFRKPLAQGVMRAIRFTRGIRLVAQAVIEDIFTSRYNAIHVRVGDYAEKTPSMGEYRRQMMLRKFTTDVPLYIATEPSTPKSLFRELCAEFDCKFSRDLREHEGLKRFSEAVPQGQIRLDMLGIIEQLICVGAKHFSGTGYSTFSAKIVQMRKLRSFSFPEFDQSEEELEESEKQKSIVENAGEEGDGDDLDDETRKDMDN